MNRKFRRKRVTTAVLMVSLLTAELMNVPPAGSFQMSYGTRMVQAAADSFEAEVEGIEPIECNPEEDPVQGESNQEDVVQGENEHKEDVVQGDNSHEEDTSQGENSHEEDTSQGESSHDENDALSENDEEERNESDGSEDMSDWDWEDEVEPEGELSDPSDGFDEAESMEDFTNDSPDSEPSLYEGESLIPVDRINAGDVQSIYGLGIDRAVDPAIDAVKEIYEVDRSDEGILELAAEHSGKTDAAYEDARQVFDEAILLDEPMAAALMEAGVTEEASGDRISGSVCSFRPAASEQDAMVHLSSFLLCRVRDGAGDFDAATDLNGNDESDHNGIVRTNDDINYVLSYSTSLGDGYLYNTISGTRLYLQYDLPVSSKEASFNLTAMPWLKGDGENDTPIVRETENGQQLVGYRELPDRTDKDGAKYDVPGAGTLNCVIRVHQMKSGSVLTPTFQAWIERSSGNENAASGYGAMPASLIKADPSVKISVGPYLRLKLMSVPSVGQVKFGIDPEAELLGMKSGEIIRLTGSTRAFYYRIDCGKPNGSAKGVDCVDTTKRIHVAFQADCGVSVSTKETEIGLYNVRTFSMVTPDGRESGVLRDEEMIAQAYAGDADYGTIERNSLSVRNGNISFDITGFTPFAPGEIISEGIVRFVQKEENAKKDEEKPTYWTKLTGTDLKGTCLLNGDQGEMTFPVSTKWTIEHQMERNGQFDSHLLLSNSVGLAHRLTSSDNGTDARTGYASSFTAYISVSSRIMDEAYTERSRDYFLLWDNRKVLVRGGANAVLPATLEPETVYRYITKADGSLWKSDAEMLSVDFTSADLYRKIKVWRTYDEACAFLQSVHPGEKNVHAYLCGVIVEAHTIKGQDVGASYYRRIGVKMKVREIPENICSTAMFLQAIRGYSKVLDTSYSGSNGVGDDPSVNDPYEIRSWNLRPMEYEKSVWDENGILVESSLTVKNTSEKGNTLYIEPYVINVEETFEDGTEAKTFDLAEADGFTIRVVPKFEAAPESEKASFFMDLPALQISENNPACTKDEVLVMRKDETTCAIKAGDQLTLAELGYDAPGQFEVKKTDQGLALMFSGINTARELPVFLYRGMFDKSKLDSKSSLTHTTVVSGDGLVQEPDSTNGHLASVGMTFVETNGNALKIQVDRAVIANEEELQYKITYSNLYSKDHELDLTDLFPYHQDLKAEDMTPHTGSDPLDADLMTSLSEGALLSFVEGSAAVTTSAGSKVTLETSKDRIHASGILKSGEEVVITYSMKLTGALTGDVIRNSCMQKDEFGTVISNRVETKVLLPDLRAPITLQTGGNGTASCYFAAVLLLAFSLIAARKRRMV